MTMGERSLSKPPGDVFYPRVVALLATLVLGYLLYLILLPFLGPVVWAMFLAFLLQPLHRWLVRRLRGREGVSAILPTMVTLVLLIGPIAGLGAAFISQAGLLLNGAQTLLAERGANSLELTQIPGLSSAMQWLDRYFNVSAAQVQSWAIEGVRAVLQLLASKGGELFLGALGTVMGFTLTMFMLYFFVRDGVRMFEAAKLLIPLSPQRRKKLLEHLGNVTTAVVLGTGLTALLQGTLVGVAFAIVGLPSPVVFGALSALLALLPVGGTAFVWAPATVALALQSRWFAAVFMLVWGLLLVGTIDNLLRPVLVSGRAPIGTLTVFIGVLGGVAAFGTIGLFLGPVVLALVIALLRFIVELRQEIESA